MGNNAQGLLAPALPHGTPPLIRSIRDSNLLGPHSGAFSAYSFNQSQWCGGQSTDFFVCWLGLLYPRRVRSESTGDSTRSRPGAGCPGAGALTGGAPLTVDGGIGTEGVGDLITNQSRITL